MWIRIRASLTYANVASSLALLLALTGGVAWAATKLAPNSVKSVNIVPGGVTSSDIKDRTIRLKDLSREVTGGTSTATGGSGANGLQGPKGETGAKGEPGAPGAPGADATVDGRRMSQAPVELVAAAGAASSHVVATIGPLTFTIYCVTSSYPFWLIKVTSNSTTPTGVYGAVEADNQSIDGYRTLTSTTPADGLVVARGAGGSPRPFGVNWGATVVLADGTIHDVRSIIHRIDVVGTDNDRCVFPDKALVERVSQVG